MNETLSHYERNAAREAGRYESISALTIETVLERWIPRGARVLELGCGSGRDARRMAARGVRVTATDGSEEMLRIARNLAKDIEGIRFQKLPLRARPRAMSCEPARKHSPRSAHRRPLTRSSRSAFFSTWTTLGSLTRPSSSTPC